MQDLRQRVWNLGLVGPEKLQQEIVKTIANRNLKDKEKILGKLKSNPKNFVICNLSNGVSPVLSLVKTPGDVRHMRNISVGCFISDYLVFTLEATEKERVF